MLTDLRGAGCRDEMIAVEWLVGGASATSAAETNAATRSAARMPHDTPIQVLVISSDAVLRAAMCAYLNREGCIATGVPDASTAIGRIARSRVDVIVEDVSRTCEEPDPAEPAIATSGPPVVSFGAGGHARSLSDLSDTVVRVAKAKSERTMRATLVPRFTSPADRRFKLLLVDDSEMTLELIQVALNAAGFDVRIAAYAAEALAIVATWRPDVAVVDLRRPDATGRSLCALLKEHGVRLTLVASSLTEAELLRASREAAADGYVSKAKGVKGLVARVEELVARSLGRPSVQPAGGIE